MANKNENKLSYLQMPLPNSRNSYRMTKRSWSGLNYRETIDTGELSAEKNISTLEAPYLTPSQKRSGNILSGVSSAYVNPLGIFGFDDFLLVVYGIENGNSREIKLDYIAYKNNQYTRFTSILKENASSEDISPRCIVQFNVYDTPTDPVSGSYTKKLLIFPDKLSMNFINIETYSNNVSPYKPSSGADHNKVYYNTSQDKFFKWDIVPVAALSEPIQETVESGDEQIVYDWMEVTLNDVLGISTMEVLVKEYDKSTSPYTPPDTASHNYYYKNTATGHEGYYKWVDDESDKSKSGWTLIENPGLLPKMPDIKYATVHLSRLFGVDDYRVYASGFNDYTNWNLDTIDEYNESNAWCSPAQSNTKAGGVFTGITNYQGHIVCFKRDFMHEIYNSKNPFRIQDIYAEGAIDNRTIQDVDGRLIFVSDDNVKVYTGSNPRIISYNLNMPRYVNAVSGTDGRCYYLYCEDGNNNKKLFVYDTYVDEWSEQYVDYKVFGFAHNKNGMYMLIDGYDDVPGSRYISRMDTGDYSGQTWSFETDLITNETINIKHLGKIQMLADMAAGSEISVYVLYDNEKFSGLTTAEKAKHLVYYFDNNGNTACRKTIRVKPRNTASYGIKLHIEGTGYTKLYELELFMENGGDLYA